MKPLTHKLYDPRHNHLLAAFPNGEWQRWQSLLEPVELKVGQVLFEPGRAPAHVYFPTSAVVSLVYMTQDGETAEIAVVGTS